MILDLRSIKGQRERVRRTFPGDTLSQGGGDQYRVVDTATLDLDIRKDGGKYRVVGRLEATLELGCCRCLESLPLVVGVDVDLLFLPVSDNTGEGDFQIEESDLGTAFYRDDQIDLAQLIHEQFQLALPMKPLCRDDCRGLCPVCGGNRNTTTCQCVERWEDPRLAVLKSLKSE
ncbi:MAG: hypothetical protein CL477_11510 [Acidobacteria bacterium]|jgi:uncharacterized protein|nr:hypothetical protein [Acidobacteriota bacterium]HJN43674.1 DUF177 domain-containing protein [Vicinamibacterales bacterium]|tara:strand:- start:472 stop:993 length:522 start_codon:yes stop_codon:yes gene_type:complete